MTEMQKLAGIVVSPQKTLDDINQRPTWLLPLVLLLVFNLGVNFVVYRILITDTNFEQIARVKIQWDASAAGRHLSDASVDQQINALRRGRKYWYALPLIGVPVSMLSLSIVFYFALLLVRAGTTFRKVFAVICWSFIVYRCVGGLSTIVALLARGASKFFPGAPESWSPTSLAQFVSRTSVSPNVYSAISKLDIFLVWWLGILVIGLWKISSRLSLTKTATLVIGLEVGYLLANGVGWFAGTL